MDDVKKAREAVRERVIEVTALWTAGAPNHAIVTATQAVDAALSALVLAAKREAWRDAAKRWSHEHANRKQHVAAWLRALAAEEPGQ